jgi:selenide, water dikinase
MQGQPLPQTRDLVLVGGGHAHALMLRAWAMAPLAGVRLTVINPEPVAPYTGMLPGLIAGHYQREDLMIDLVALARFAGARVILGRATGIDRAARLIEVPGRPPVAYDLASIDIGIGSQVPGLEGAAHAVAAKPLGPYAAQWSDYLARVRAGSAPPDVVVIGAGIGGVELALAMCHRLEAEGSADARLTLLEQSAAALPHIGAGARAGLLAALRAARVDVLTGVTLSRITPDAVHLADGRVLPSGFSLMVAGAQPQGWLAATGLDLQDGFIRVGPTLQTSDPAIFAVGDCAHMSHAPRPKAGVFAVRQAPVLLHNLQAALSGGDLHAYQPQRDYLKLVSLGGKRALADKWGQRIEGAALWRWKDWIDRRFMAMFHDLPAMPAPPLPRRMADGLRAEVQGQPPLCAGCGAKVGPGALAEGLATLAAPRRADVLAGAGDDAAVLRHGTGVQVITTDQIRAFTDDPYVFARLAALHALGDIWAMGAAPQVALAQITLPRLSAPLQARSLREMLAGLSEVLAEAGADLVGGHTMEGPEASIGLTITGLAPMALPRGGARAGDAIILTRPIGTGTVLAAEMARVNPKGLMIGEVWAETLAQMGHSNAGAAQLLASRAHAMTDVTGFGLAGHLWHMARDAGLGVRLDLDAVPVLAGAETLAAQGIRSSLARANTSALPGPLPVQVKAALLVDPQTCGGLVAALPPERAAEIVALLQRSVAPQAAIIGFFDADPGMFVVS